MGLFDKIFGGSKQQSTSQSKTNKQLSTLDKLVDLYAQEIGTGQPSFAGSRVAPLTGFQQNALDLSGFGDVFSATPDLPLFETTGQSLTGLLTGQTGGELYSPEKIDNFYRQSIEAPALRQYQDFIKPEVREAFAGPGFFSSARANEQSEAAQDIGRYLGEQRARLQFDAEQANRGLQEARAGRALSAIGPALAYGQVPTQAAQTALQGRGQIASLSGIEQQQQQAEINDAILRFAEDNRLTDPEDLQILMSLLGITTNQSASSGSSTPGALAGLSGFFGGGADSGAVGLGKALPF